MNVGRGLFRGWILLTVLWLIVIDWSVFDSIERGMAEVLSGQ